MKIFFENRFLLAYKFGSSKEQDKFLSNKIDTKILKLEETFGDSYHCLVYKHGLTDKDLIVISFSCYENEDNVSLLFWSKFNLIVLTVGKLIYVISDDCKIRFVIEITTPLRALYQMGQDLLILEETSIKLVKYNGIILFSEYTDLIEEVTLENEILSIRSNCGEKLFNLREIQIKYDKSP